MRNGLWLGLAIAALAVAAAVPSAGATTAPAITVSIKVTITDTRVTFSPNAGKRGYFAYFRIRNVGKKTHRIVIGGLTSRPLKPGARAVLAANLEERGRYRYQVDGGGPRYSGYFRVL
jgi:hypothetical protein